MQMNSFEMNAGERDAVTLESTDELCLLQAITGGDAAKTRAAWSYTTRGRQRYSFKKRFIGFIIIEVTYVV